MLTRKIRRILVPIILGIVYGVVYYALYALSVPEAFSRYGLSGIVSAPSAGLLLVIFMLLGVIERTLPPAPAAPVRVLSKLVGAGYLYYATNGGVLSGYIHGETVILDVRIVVYLIIVFSLLIGVIDALGTVTSSTDMELS